MVQTRRKIVTEEDRFGGYSRRPSARVDFETDIPDEEVPVRSARRRMPSETREEAYSVVEYSTREDYPKTAEYVGPRAPQPERAVRTPRREKEDLMPSIKTRAYNRNESEEQTDSARKAQTRAHAKTRAMLGLYIAVVAVLAVAVIAIGVAVSGMNTEISALQSAIENRTQVLSGQNAQIDKLTDPNYVAGSALENGMEKIDGAIEVDLIQPVDPIEYESRTNWFDKFCDWLSTIIGG